MGIGTKRLPRRGSLVPHKKELFHFPWAAEGQAAAPAGGGGEDDEDDGLVVGDRRGED